VLDAFFLVSEVPVDNDTGEPSELTNCNTCNTKKCTKKGANASTGINYPRSKNKSQMLIKNKWRPF